MIVSLPDSIDRRPTCRAGPRRAESAGSDSSGPRPARDQDPAPFPMRWKQSTEHFVITAFGPDQPGIVRRFSQYLAGKDINIVDLYGDRKGDDFVLIGQVQVPVHWDIRMMQADLAADGPGTWLHREAATREHLRGDQSAAGSPRSNLPRSALQVVFLYHAST